MSLMISCDDCSMRCTSVCSDCVVTYLLGDGCDPVELDGEQARVIDLFGAAGMVPLLRFDAVP